MRTMSIKQFLKLIKRMERRSALVGLLVVLVIAGGIWLLADHSSTSSTMATSKTKALPPPATAVIEITSAGFIPSTLAIHADTKVVWVNEDVMPHLPAAGPYPTRADMPNLVAPRALGDKETYSFLFTKTGTIQYDDNLNPSLTGTIEIR